MPVDQKFYVQEVAPTNYPFQKTRLNDLSYSINIWTVLSSILSQSTRLTDRQTDGQLSHRYKSPCLVIIIIIITRLNSMQHG